MIHPLYIASVEYVENLSFKRNLSQRLQHYLNIRELIKRLIYSFGSFAFSKISLKGNLTFSTVNSIL